MDDEEEGLLLLVKHIGHGHGEKVRGSFHRSDHVLGFGDQVQEVNYILECLLGDLVGVDLSDLS